ncbi:MAG: thioredoxin domain-containing protein [Candidatus Saccharibacteria bacterium]
MDKRFLIILSVIVLAVVGVFWFNKSKSTTSSKANTSQASNHVIGNNTKGVTLVEYGDYQCPACGQFYPIVKQLQKTYANDISFRFANFPLVQIHPNAMSAARAAESAALQGKFWEMHDLLYENQSAWSAGTNAQDYYEQFAKSLGLDMNKFKTDMASQAVSDAINADISQAQGLGATGTPTFVVNGKKIETNPKSLEEFSKLIDQTIKDAKKS